MAKQSDVLVLGGGAAGMMAAIAAARGGAKVRLLEAGERVGKKLLATGNGRCNLSNMNMDAGLYNRDIGGICMVPGELLALFEEMGLRTKHDSAGRVYPASDAASSVLDVLRLELARLGVEQSCGFRAEKVKKTDRGFVVGAAGGQQAQGTCLVLCCGSRASAQVDGSGLAEQLGHRVAPLEPGLCPLLADKAETAGLRGLRVQGEITLYINEEKIHAEPGELLFKDGQLSGIAVFNLSRRLRGGAAGRATVGIDLLPELSFEETLALLGRRRQRFGALELNQFFTGMCHKQIGLALLGRSRARAKYVGQLDDAALATLAALLKDWRFGVGGKAGWQQAQLALGGVLLDELDAQLQSRIHRGLYFAGEMLDVDGPCGGFNLHFAWSSGHLVGQAAAENVKGMNA